VLHADFGDQLLDEGGLLGAGGLFLLEGGGEADDLVVDPLVEGEVVQAFLVLEGPVLYWGRQEV